MSQTDKLSADTHREEAEQFELTTDYANNVALEPTVWDIKAIFGEYSARAGAVDWHTSVTIPWTQAKLLSFYLQVQIAVYEVEHGPIQIPDSVIPPPPPPMPEPDSPKSQAIVSRINELRARFLDSLK